MVIENLKILVQDKKDNFHWKFRCFLHKHIKKTVFSFNKFIIHSFVCNKKIIQVNKYNNKDYDPYTYCKAELRNYCPVGKNHSFTLIIRNYSFSGDTIEECYCKAINAWYGKSPLTYPTGYRFNTKED